MSTLADYPQARATPRKLGPPPRLSANARDEYYRQLDYLAAEGVLDVRTKDFLRDVTYTYSDRAGKDFYPSQATMSELRRCSRRTLQRRVAAAKAAGVMLVAQLKGYDAKAGAWFCSSNTHRIAFVPEWVEKLKESRAAKRAAARDARTAAKAPRKGPRRRDEGESRPQVPEFDQAEVDARESEALEPNEVRSRARALRAVIMPGQPPPTS